MQLLLKYVFGISTVNIMTGGNTSWRFLRFLFVKYPSKWALCEIRGALHVHETGEFSFNMTDRREWQPYANWIVELLHRIRHSSGVWVPLPGLRQLVDPIFYTRFKIAFLKTRGLLCIKKWRLFRNLNRI